MKNGAYNNHQTLAGVVVALIGSILIFSALSIPAQSSSVDTPYTFTAGTPAVAAEVNANFAALQSAIEALQSQVASLNGELISAQDTIADLQGELTLANSTISDLQGELASSQSTISTVQGGLTSANRAISTLQGQVSGINSSSIMALGSHLEEISSNNFALTGINLHLRNGEGQTASSNSLGNLIIGYNEDPDAPPGFWDLSIGRGGSHYLVVGMGHQWSQYGGILVGRRNIASNSFSSVIGGFGNTASGESSSITGGRFNIASGVAASISGGLENTAIGLDSSISGGVLNNATGVVSSILGGNAQTVDTGAGHYP